MTKIGDLAALSGNSQFNRRDMSLLWGSKGKGRHTALALRLFQSNARCIKEVFPGIKGKAGNSLRIPPLV